MQNIVSNDAMSLIPQAQQEVARLSRRGATQRCMITSALPVAKQYRELTTVNALVTIPG